ncbi:DBH-like monooxygenase protein 1 isoform X2 [Folsomia candida]|nr:DBH-like monooxygenase protein 1 isoform X2 [Folsomia candida]
MFLNSFRLLWLFIVIPNVTPVGRQLDPTCSVDWNLAGKTSEEIVFDLSCNVTSGWIGLGLSRNGAMSGADIVTARLLQNGTIILDDRHGVGNQKPIRDIKSDYKLLASSKNSSHTTVKFSRLLNTCDKDGDVEITDDTLKLIWAWGALGPAENLTQHKPTNRGAIVVNLLDKKVTPPPPIHSSINLGQTVTLNSNATLYTCKIHKLSVQQKNHVIGYEVYFQAQAKQYAHHASVLSCTPPSGASADQFFSQYADQEYDCYYTDKYFPTEHCKFFEFQWTLGGVPTYFPEELGVPIGEQKDQYYMTMFHINNPLKENGLEFRLGFNLFYTQQLRKHDIGFLQLGLNSSRAYSLTVPPNSAKYVLSSHCPGDCTKILPTSGIQVFVYLLHFHLSGKKMKIRHFREGVELPWIGYDGNYDTNFQMSRMMRKHVTVLPNDHITVECEFGTKEKWLNGSTVIGGRGIGEEMCQAFLMYYPRTKELNRCGSSVEHEQLLKFMGIDKVKM